MDIKTIAGDVAAKAGSLAKTAVKKTGEAAEAAKLTLLIKSEQKKLDSMFTVLGKLFYEQTKGTDVRAQIVAQMMEINEHKNIISDLKATMIENSGKIICDSCGKEIDLEHPFCPECGKKIEPKLLHRDYDEEELNSEADSTEAIDSDSE